MADDRLARVVRWCERPEPFHLSLFVSLLIVKLWIFLTGEHPLVNSLEPIRTAWTVLGFMCPLMVFAGYALIYRTTGRSRFLGYWLRLGGDAGQLFLLPIFIGGFLFHPMAMGFSDPVHAFAAGLIIPVLPFMMLMTVRDIAILAGLEKVANQIDADR